MTKEQQNKFLKKYNAMRSNALSTGCLQADGQKAETQEEEARGTSVR